MRTTIQCVVLDGSTPKVASQAQHPVEIAEGEYAEITMEFVGENGVAFPLDGYNVYSQARKGFRTKDPLFSKGATVSGSSAVLELFQASTAGKKGSYLWDGFVTEIATNKSYRFMLASRFIVLDAVTDLNGIVVEDPSGGLIMELPAQPDPNYKKRLASKDDGTLVWQQFDSVTAVFDGNTLSVSVTWGDFDGRDFRISYGLRSTEITGVTFENITDTGCDVVIEGYAVGSVDIAIDEVIS